MADVTFNINTDASVALVNKLEAIHRSALPLAIRGTLNAAAFDVKQRTLDDSATQNFIRRSPTFFKRFSGVNRATGWNINNMQAEVGMTANGDKKAATAISHMVQQEFGGNIGSGLDYLAGSRAGNNDRKVVRSKYYSKANTVRGKFANPSASAKSRRVAAAYVALREGKQLSIKIGQRRFLSQVTSISKTKKGKVRIRSKLLSAGREGHASKITATHFSREAAFRTVPSIPRFFEKEGQKQIARLWK